VDSTASPAVATSLTTARMPGSVWLTLAATFVASLPMRSSWEICCSMMRLMFSLTPPMAATL
jgi:hypothetical protein